MNRNNEAEYGVVAGCLMSAKVLDICENLKVKADWFYDPIAREVYSASLAVRGMGGEVDVITVASWLRDKGTLNVVGGIDGLMSVIEGHPIPDISEYHIGIVRSAYYKRYIRSVLAECEKLLGDPSYGPEVVAEETLGELETMFGEDRTQEKGLSSGVAEGIQQWEDIAAKKSNALKTGVSFIDRALGGIPRRSLVIVSGQKGSSKTTLVRQIAEGACKLGRRVAVRSLEQSVDQISQAILGSVAGITVSSMNVEPEGQDEKDARAMKLKRVREASKEIMGWNLVLDDRVSTVGEFRAWAKKQAREGAELIILDYIQRLLPDHGAKYSSQEEHVRAASTVLYEVSKTTGVPIIAVASENRAGQIRSSGQAEYDAWAIIQIKRTTEDTFGEYDPFENPCYVAWWEKARFAPSHYNIPLYWHYGRLIEKEDWEERKSRSLFAPGG